MNSNWKWVWCVCVLLNLQCSKGVQAQLNKYDVIPMPAKLEVRKGEFTIDDDTKLCVVNYSPEWESMMGQFNDAVAFAGGVRCDVTTCDAKAQPDNTIMFVVDTTVQGREAYSLEVSGAHVVVRGGGMAGVFYGICTLRQLMQGDTVSGQDVPGFVTLPCCAISDGPRFGYRGMHLDVCRHMFSMEFIKKYIDLMSQYKYNTFHWHLTDDQGWRAEIKAYPALTAKGGWRKETTTMVSRDKESVTIREPYGGYYTQVQMREIVDYAAKRYITVIPEIEMPGHSLAAISAYPFLGCTGKQVDVGTRWGVFEDVFCPYDTTFGFLQQVLTEIMEIFPSPYIHIGGDECLKEAWKQSEYCRQLMKREGLKDELELQSYFVHRIEKFLNSKGRQMIGWDEILEGGLSPNATVMSWRGFQGGIDAARANHDVIMTPGSHCYFDHYQYVRAKEPYAIGGFSPVEKVYGFNPIPMELDSALHKHILGAQCNLWTEYITTASHAEYMAYPRACALAEVLWTPMSLHNYDSFLDRLSHSFHLLDEQHVNYATHVMGVFGNMQRLDNGTLQYVLQTKNKHAVLKYAMNDTSMRNAKTYTAPVIVKGSVTISGANYEGEKRVSEVYTQAIDYHSGAGATVVQMSKWHDNYNPGSSSFIVNAINGSTNYGDGQWFGYSGTDCEVVIALASPQHISGLRTHFIDKRNSWIYPPQEVVFYCGNDTASMQQVCVVKPIGGSVVNTVSSPKLDITAKYIKMVLRNYGIIPAGNDGAGNGAWLFVDELVVVD